MTGKKSDVGRLLDMVHGFRQTAVITAALELGVFEAIAAGGDEGALAQAVGAHPQSLSRLVRALRAFGLVAPEALSLTPMGRLLLKDTFGVRDWVHLIGAEYLPAWTRLAHSVKTGETAFAEVFGTSAWEWRKAHPADDEAFNRVMAGAQARAAAALLDAWDFAGARTIVDVGGGRGHLLMAVLKRYSDARGVLFDQPHVVLAAPSHERVTIAGGSFLETVPAGDVLLLKHCLHNWDDGACVEILGHCKTAVGAGVLLVLEDVMPPEPDEALVMLDLHMLAVAGGRERTRDEHEALLQAAGLRLERHIATREGAPDVLVARA